MNKKLLLFLVLLPAFANSQQLFQQGKFYADVGALGARYIYNFAENVNGFNFSGTERFNGIGVPLRVVYAFNKRFDVGIEGNWISYQDTSGKSASGTIYNADVLVNGHFYTTKYFDFFCGVEGGYSHFQYNINDETFATGGLNGRINLGGRYVFIKNLLGIYLLLDYNWTSLSQGKLNSSDTNIGYDVSSSFHGWEISGGLTLKF